MDGSTIMEDSILISKASSEKDQLLAVLGRDVFFRCAVKHIAEGVFGKDRVLTYRSSNDFLRALSDNDKVNTAIVDYDVLYSENFSLLDAINDYFPKLNNIVVISNPNIQLVSLIRSLNINKIISAKDDISSFIKVLTIERHEEYYSPRIIRKIKNMSIKPPLLTIMERYVLKNLIKGVSPRLIATWKGISIKTVSTHKNKALNKINVGKLNDLVLRNKINVAYRK
ncbi:LuxR C-terminal-related transcriptional regulator [Serratia marcescens]|uniref:LuxR C-terminal-related transcriptional regulator n=1 Tax=Serratia TaxID=613 RepID=UPI003FA73B92